MLKKYDGYEIGPNLRKIRKDKKLSVYKQGKEKNES
jgi:hypothetical protein